jgi:hypothetical protein
MAGAVVTPGFAQPRSKLPWLPYESLDRVIINAHNFTSAAWTPAQIATYLWLDAADASTIFDASSGGSLTADGGFVGRIEDKSGNARHSTQATSGDRPVRSGSTISFSAKWLSIPTAAFAANRCIVGVFNSSATGGASTGFINIRSSAGTDNPELRIGSGAAGNSLQFYWAAGYAVNATYNVATSSVHAYSFTNDDSVSCFRNGTLDVSATRAATWTSIFEVSIGRYGATAQTRSGTLRELIVCDTSNRQITEGYLAWKWSLQGSLDASHPYKSAAP